MSVNRDESEERVIHRLESFSDIVIGFSLAQLALSMAIPKAGAAEFSSHPDPLIAFVLTFGLVCAVWWSHHKLFTHYFVPVPAMIVCNFMTLAFVGLSVYGVQLMLRPHHGPADFAFFESAWACVFFLLSLQYWYGWTMRKQLIPDDVARRDFRLPLLLCGQGVIFALAAWLTIRYRLGVTGIQYAAYMTFIYAVAVRLALRSSRLNQSAPEIR